MSGKTKVIGATVGTPLSLSKIKEKFSPYIRQQGYEEETGYIYNLEIGKEYKLVCEPLVGDPSDFEKAYISCYIPEEGEAIAIGFSLSSSQTDTLTLKILGIEGTIISYECNGEMKTYDVSYNFADTKPSYTLGGCTLREWSGEFFIRNPDGITGGKTPYIQDGYWYIDGVNTNVKAEGKDGYTPINGIDYNTPADKSEFSEYIASELAKRGQLKPEPAQTLADMTDTSLMYVLLDKSSPDYGYIYANVKKTVIINPTDLIPLSIKSDKTPYVGDNGEDGYNPGYRLSGSSGESKASTYGCTGFIECTANDIIRTKNISFDSETNSQIQVFNSEFTRLTTIASNSAIGNVLQEILNENGDIEGTLSQAITTLDSTELNDIVYIRICGLKFDDSAIVTKNEEIESGTTTIYEWTNTGLAFIPADYEDRIISLETDLATAKEDIKELQNSTNTTPSGETVPQAVVSGASNLVDKALSRESNRFLRFLICSDAHHKNDDELITKGTKELGQAHSEILKRIGVDFVANLGDITWGSSASDSATCLEEGKAFNKFMLDNIRGQMQIWTEGNHETDLLTASQIHALIYSHNKGLVKDANHWIEGYGYMDFPYQKVRVICLNTEQGTAKGMSDEQVKWFAEVALNMEGKTDWGVITMGHHPLSYNTVSLMRYASETVKAFINGDNFSYTTNDGTKLNIDYSNKNCQYIGHFHGHAHAFSVVKMQHYVSSGVYEEFDAWEICIPNACYTRNNQYLGASYEGQYVQRYTTETTYNKTDEDGKRTSFNLVTVCLDEKKIYADNYGAGIDREISY